MRGHALTPNHAPRYMHMYTRTHARTHTHADNERFLIQTMTVIVRKIIMPKQATDNPEMLLVITSKSLI